MNFNSKSLKTIILSIVIIFLSLSAILNFIVDPENTFHNYSIERFNKYKYKRTQLDVLYNATKNIKNYDTIIFGTSRSAIYGSNNDIFSDKKIINLSDIVYGYPSRIYKFLQSLPPEHNIKNIYIGLDIHTMSRPKGTLEDFRNDLFYRYPSSAKLLAIIYKLLPTNLSLVYLTIKNNFLGKKPLSTMDQNGVRYYEEFGHKFTYDQYSIQKKIKFDNTELGFLKKIEQFGKNKNINISFFTFPYSVEYYMQDYSQSDIRNLFSKILGYVSGIYNFSYINHLTKNRNNYFNRKHHNHNFDTFIKRALVKKEKSFMLNGEVVFTYDE